MLLFDGMRGLHPLRAVSISPYVGFGETGSVADAVDAWTWGFRAGSLVLTIARFIGVRRHLCQLLIADVQMYSRMCIQR